MFVLTLALIALAVALLFALRDDAPEIEERVEREPDFDFGGSWLTAVPESLRTPECQRRCD